MDPTEGEHGSDEVYAERGGQLRQPLAGASPVKPSSGVSRSGFGPTAYASASASKLPPLMKGSRLSVLSTYHGGAPGEEGDEGDGFAPSCGPGGRPGATRGEDGDGRWGDRQQAWVERDQEGGSGPAPGLGKSGQDEFPFLDEDEMEMVLPDDRFEVRRRIIIYVGLAILTGRGMWPELCIVDFGCFGRHIVSGLQREPTFADDGAVCLFPQSYPLLFLGLDRTAQPLIESNRTDPYRCLLASLLEKIIRSVFRKTPARSQEMHAHNVFGSS